MKADGSEKHSGRRMLTAIAVIAGGILLLLLGVTVRAGRMLSRINYADPAAVPTLSQQELDELVLEELPSTGAACPETSPMADMLALGKDDGVINILLIGQDRRTGQSRARSDTMILCTIHRQSGKLILTSFLRDLWVQIPGYRDNKLNAAYAAGGMKLLNETLAWNFGVQVDGNVEVDFSQFARLIDLLGGVEIELRADEAAHINRCVDGSALQTGTNILTGSQALCYARIRKLDPDADFSRTGRQRRLLDALIRKYKDAPASRLLDILEELLPMVTTDMTRNQIVSYGAALFPMLKDLRIVSQRIPADGTYTTPTIRGMSVVLADMEEARKLLRQMLTD